MKDYYINQITNSSMKSASKGKNLIGEEITKAASFEALSVPRRRNGIMDFGASQMENYRDDNYFRMGINSSSPVVGL